MYYIIDSCAIARKYEYIIYYINYTYCYYLCIIHLIFYLLYNVRSRIGK